MALKTRSRTGFVYKPRSVEQFKERANRKTSLFDSIYKQGTDTFKARQGDNLIRFLPPTWDDADHYGYTIYVHRNVGANNSTYLCLRKMLNKPCPCCEAEKEARDAGEKEEADQLRASERIVSWILDRDADDPEKPIVYETSWTQDRDISSLCINERTGSVLMIDHPDKGFDVTIKRSGTGLKTKYFGYAIAREDSPINDSEKVQDEILEFIKENPIPNILHYYDYDYLKGVLSGTVAEKDKDLEQDDDDLPPKRSSKRARDEEDDEPPFETDEKPKRSQARRDRQEEDEEVEDRRTSPRNKAAKRRDDDEEDDDAPPPKSRDKASRSRVEDDEEEDERPSKSARPRVADDEEEEDERPARSRRDTPDEKPAKRRQVIEDDEEEDDVPRRRR
jgi:hypothetical protein